MIAYNLRKSFLIMVENAKSEYYDWMVFVKSSLRIIAGNRTFGI